MKATDLRIGNHIWALHEESESVVTVDADHLAIQERYDADPDADEFSRGWHYKGIPLTENRIKDFGLGIFTGDDGITATSISRCLHLIKAGDYWCLSYREYGNRIYNDLRTRINTVHQLQNLVYLLTGRELECPQPAQLNEP